MRRGDANEVYLILASAKSTKVLGGLGRNIGTKNNHDTTGFLVADGNI